MPVAHIIMILLAMMIMSVVLLISAEKMYRHRSPSLALAAGLICKTLLVCMPFEYLHVQFKLSKPMHYC